MFELKRQLNCRVEIKEWISHLFSSKMQNAVLLHNISANNQNSASSLCFLWENYRFWGGLNICMCINSTAAVLHICSRFRSNFLQINYCTRLQSLSPTLEVIFSPEAFNFLHFPMRTLISELPCPKIVFFSWISIGFKVQLLHTAVKDYFLFKNYILL